MRRLPLASLAALCLVAPAVTRAQDPFIITSAYAIHGCGDGVVGYAGEPPKSLLGTVGCLDGSAVIGALGALGTPAFRLDYRLTLAPGVSILQPVYSELGYAYSGVPCVGASGCFGAEDPSGSFFDSGRIYTFGYLPANVTDARQLRFVQGDVVYETRVPNAPFPGDEFIIPITFTATPEPATLAFTLGGLAVLGAGAWRRRRA